MPPDTHRSPPRPLDPERLKHYATRVFGHLEGAMTSAMVYLGDQLGLYRALAGAGPITSAGLAERTGLHERWLREWLHQQGAAGVLVFHGDGRFELDAEGEAVLANEAHPACGIGFFAQLPTLLRVAEQLPAAFRTGLGLPYDAFGPEGAAGIERGLAPWFRALLVPFALPRVPGALEPLQRGVRVADVGCGAGVALLEMAKAFPHSEFHGYDISQHALARAEAKREEAGIRNAHFHDARREPLPEDGSFGFVTSFDCLHDMTDPAGMTQAIRRALRDDGLWLIADIKAHDSYERNVEKNPMAAMMYGTSVLSCLSSALSEPGGAGLGTLGLTSDRLQRMTEAAGFSRFEPLDLGHPVNAFYVVRP
jgi:2-polyprenyl-3-methyl-5-hydroxy-6-metoxy-1,4-benzoquinol methylase